MPQPRRKAIGSPFAPPNRGRSPGPARRSRGPTAASGGCPRARFCVHRARAELRICVDGARLAPSETRNSGSSSKTWRKRGNRSQPNARRSSKKRQSPRSNENLREQRIHRNCALVNAVRYEPVSASKSLITGKITGNFENSGRRWRFSFLVLPTIQTLTMKFPT
jgi:hypothetical protein